VRLPNTRLSATTPVTLENDLLAITVLPEKGATFILGSKGYPWYGSCYVMAIEPFTSIPGTGLQNAILADIAPIIPAGGTVEVQLAAWLVDGQQRIEALGL
jgi:hypothetical protein